MGINTDIEIFCITEEKRFDITDIVENGLSWKKTLSEFAFILDFSIGYRKVKDLPLIPVKEGSVMEVFIDKRLTFSGIVLSENYGEDTEPVSYRAVDFTYYFNQNKEIFQFKKEKADACIAKILEAMKAPIGIIENNNTQIDRVYYNRTLGEIIKEIIKLTLEEKGEIWHFFYKDGKFHFLKSPKSKFLDGEVEPMVLACEYEGNKYNIFDMKIKPQNQNSIEGMRNSVKAITVDGENVSVISEKKDESLISKYGIFQEVLKLSKDDSSKAEESAKNLLKEKGRVFKKRSFRTLGEINADPGAVIMDSIGKVYEIKSVNFTWDDRLFMDLEVEVVG